MKYSSNGLIKSLMILSIAGFVILALALTAVFTNAFYKNIGNLSSNLEVTYNKNAKIEAMDKIKKITDFIEIYKKTLEQNAKQKVKDNVKFAMIIIDSTYKQFKNFPRKFIYKKIDERLRNIRFFNNNSGYFSIYDLKGYCVLLPTTPSLEGTNQINLQDASKRYTIRRLIKIAKTKGEGFATWSWYKINGKQMKKKLGYIQLYKPLGIFVGTARYEEDILNDIKRDVKFYLKKLDKDEYGYIFAYDFSGNSMLENKNFKNINRWNDIVRGNHIVRNAIRGAQIIPDGFFIRYISKDNEEKFSYVKLIPGFDWIVGVNVQNTKKIYKRERRSLQKNMSIMLRNAIFIVVFILIIFILGFLLVSFKIRRLFKELADTVEDKTAELMEQKNVFKKLFDTASDGISLSKHKKIYDCNDSTLRIFEAKDKEEFLQLETKEYFPIKQEDGMNSMDFLEQKLDIGGKEGSVEFEIMAKTFKGRDIWLNIVATQIVLQHELAGYFVFRDITQKKRVEKDLQIQQKKLIFQAKHDPLTSLPNRMFLMDRLSQSMKRAKRVDRYLAVAFLDIDNFKIVNDAFGHDVGDLLLIEIASVLRGIVRATDTISRVSGDEFVLVTDDLDSIEDNTSIIQKILDRFQEPFYIKNNPFNITFSIGISVYPNDAKDEHSLLKYADMAMYRAKNSGKNRYVYYDESMNTDILEHIKIEQEIRRGIQNDEFILHYQPQFDVITGDIVGFEALVRWQHPKLGLKYPDYFIQIAENSSLMIPLGEIISKKAMQQIASWYADGFNPGIMSINFTSKQLESSNFFEKMADLLKETGCEPEWIEAELIERYVMRDTKKTTDLLKCFKDIGIKVAIDDFGTGYSSLSYLKYLEISKLKIDKAFIDELENDKKDQAIAKSIIDLSVGLELEVLAEGVETKKQFEILRDLGCQIIQGYYFSKPISSDDAKNLMIKKAEEKQLPPR